MLTANLAIGKEESFLLLIMESLNRVQLYFISKLFIFFPLFTGRASPTTPPPPLDVGAK